jgi:hypothetical protein
MRCVVCVSVCQVLIVFVDLGTVDHALPVAHIAGASVLHWYGAPVDRVSCRGPDHPVAFARGALFNVLHVVFRHV